MRPWVKLDALVFQDPRFAALKTDGQRLAYIAALCQAKLAREEGRWSSRAHLEVAVGRHAKHLDALLEVGLLESDASGGICVAYWGEQRGSYPSDQPDATRARKRVERARKASDGWGTV